jgi:hypothetical protein
MLVNELVLGRYFNLMYHKFFTSFLTLFCIFLGFEMLEVEIWPEEIHEVSFLLVSGQKNEQKSLYGVGGGPSAPPAPHNPGFPLPRTRTSVERLLMKRV